MYRVLSENRRRRMTREELGKEFDGKWIFLTQIVDEPFSAVPTVIADTPMEGSEDGVYDSFIETASLEGGATGELSLLKWTVSISGFKSG
jgi:hypothetical protein